MQAAIVVKIHQDDLSAITAERNGQAGLVFQTRDDRGANYLFPKLTLLFPDIETLGKAIDRLHAKMENLRKPIEEKGWM